MGITGDQSRSESAESEPPSRRRFGRLGQAGIALAILVVALAVFASQQGGDSGGSGPLNAIAQAAEKTRSEPGGRAVMRAVVSEPGSEPITMTGHMVFDDEDRSRAVLTAQLPDSEDSMRMNLIGEGTDMYMSSSRFGSLPDGDKWMAFDLSLGQKIAPVSASPNPKGELELLETVSGDVRKLGREDVHGVPTTRYSGTVGVSEQADNLRELGAEDFAARTEKEGSPSRVEVWVDADGLVRRIRLVHTQPQVKGEGTERIDMRMDFFDFGIEPQIDVPDSDEVFDATALAEEGLREH